MVTYRLHGRITEEGKLEVDLPEGLAPGDVEVTVVRETAPSDHTGSAAWEEQPWTDEEIEALMRVEPKTGAEIVEEIRRLGGGWEEMGITDSVAWVEEQRRKRRERLKWSLD